MNCDFLYRMKEEAEVFDRQNCCSRCTVRVTSHKIISKGTPGIVVCYNVYFLPFLRSKQAFEGKE